MNPRYTVGIDLGTSNTVVAYAATAEAGANDEPIQLFYIEQLVGPGEVASAPLLPSLRYHPAPGELGAVDLNLPWPQQAQGDVTPAIIGRYARQLGAQVPGRLVASAKSWLSHPGVDRTAAILPWGAGDDVPKVSPVTASASYLAHVRAAWLAQFPDAPLEQQDIVLTVPASFDEGARALTVEAACLAGLPKLRLLEEPQAAFHDWLFRHRRTLVTELQQTRLVLVCDVGGGTTDLTLIQVDHTSVGQLPRLTRIGVGDHLMLGGDNMDLALAHLVEQRMGAGTPLPAARFSQLVQRCRVAKEQLLAADAPERTTVTLLGAGSSLVGAARSVDLTRDDVVKLVVDGFMPQEAASERPRRRRSGIVEFGLPYPADPAITRHLAAFLARHGDAARRALGKEASADGVTDTLAVPDTLLLNGGVFNAPMLSRRLENTLAGWRAGAMRVLHNDEPDLAVARGAVAYALVRAARVPELGSGIGGGSARSYFLVLEDGVQPPRGICVLPRGTEAGHAVHLSSHSFNLRLGQAVRFHLMSSVAHTPWRAGDLVVLDPDVFVRLPALAAVLPAPQGRSRVDVSVQLVASITEVGTLEMQCIGTDDASQRWLLAFQLRGDAANGRDADSQSNAAHPRLPDAIALIERVFGTSSQPVDAKEVRQLRTSLEGLLGRREDWDLPLLRALFDVLWARAKRRRRSAEHERTWLNLTGYCLRPGMGAPLDEWRVEQVWSLFAQGIQFVGDSRNWSEWWTLWRRAAGGLNEAQQLHLLELAIGHLEGAEGNKLAKDPIQGSHDDLVRLAAVLENVPVMHRVDVGHWLIDRLQRCGEKPQAWWAVGRVGARVSMYGSAHHVVPPESAALWLSAILALDWKAVEPAAFAAAQIARMSGDRARDIAPDLRSEVARRLTAVKAPPSWVRMVSEAVQLEEADQKRSFGEGLPPGLKLIES